MTWSQKQQQTNGNQLLIKPLDYITCISLSGKACIHSQSSTILHKPAPHIWEVTSPWVFPQIPLIIGYLNAIKVFFKAVSMNFYSLVCVLKRGIIKVILGSILCAEDERHNEIGYQWKGSSFWRWVWKLLINVTYEDVSTIFVLLVPCLAVLHTHLQHSFIHFLNVFDVSVKSNTLITINSTLN